MAALTGVMTADFTGFLTEVDKADAKLKKLDSTSRGTSEGMQEFSHGINQVDASLNAVGINVGKPLRALQEMSALAGKNVGDMGFVALAGSITTTGVAAYEATRAVIDLAHAFGYDLDTAVRDASAKLLGWGDLAGETAAAKMMNLSRASEIAGRTITDVGEALRIITKHNADTNQSFNTGAQRVKEWQGELDRVRSKLPEIAAELKNHNSTNKEIAEHYGISTRALEYYNRTLTESAKAQKAWADEARPKYEAIRVAQEELAHATGGWHAALAAIAPATAKAAMEAMNLGVSQNTVAKALNLTTLQVDALDRQMKLNLGTMAVTEPALGSLDAWIKQNTNDTAAWNNEWRFTSEVIGEQVNPEIEQLAANVETVSTAMDTMKSTLSMGGPGGGTVNTAGITIADQTELWKRYNATHFGPGVGGYTEDALTYGLRSGLAGQTGGGFNAPNIVNITMNGMLGTDDPQTRNAVKTMVDDAMMESMRGQRLLSSA